MGRLHRNRLRGRREIRARQCANLGFCVPTVRCASAFSVASICGSSEDDNHKWINWIYSGSAQPDSISTVRSARLGSKPDERGCPNNLFAPVRSFPGVNSERERQLNYGSVWHGHSTFFFFPRDYRERPEFTRIADLRPNVEQITSGGWSSFAPRRCAAARFQRPFRRRFRRPVANGLVPYARLDVSAILPRPSSSHHRKPTKANGDRCKSFTPTWSGSTMTTTFLSKPKKSCNPADHPAERTRPSIPSTR